MTARTPGRRSQLAPLAPVLIYALLAAGYFVLRQAGRWSDPDTAHLTKAAAALQREATLLPVKGGYGLGFAYQAVSVVITAVTGLSLTQLQFLVYPLVAAGLSVTALVMYRQLTGDAIAGAVACILLFVQPDFMFVVFRGSHEKVTWLAAMLAVFLLARSFEQTRPARFAVHVFLFYLVALTVIGSNAFFGSSFILAIGFSLVAGRLLQRASGRGSGVGLPSAIVARLFYVVAAVMVLWFLNAFYLYTPASRLILELGRASDRVAAVSLGHEPGFDPYGTIGLGWVSQFAYLALTLPGFITGAVSLVVWLRYGGRFLRGGIAPRRFLLLWLLYGAFGTQFAIAIILDRFGAIGGNLQLRLFPAIMLMALPLVSISIVNTLRAQGRALGGSLLRLGVTAFLLWAGAASLLKATNDPWLSNYWNFSTASEDRAVQWAEGHLRNRSIWLGPDGARLSSRAESVGLGTESGNRSDTFLVDPETRDLVLSVMDVGLVARRGGPMPDVRYEHRVYDNGEVANYHLRPRTAYQR